MRSTLGWSRRLAYNWAVAGAEYAILPASSGRIDGQSVEPPRALNYPRILLPRFILPSLTIFLLLAPCAGASTLAETCRDALASDPGVAGADHAVREASERVTLARSSLFPKLSLIGAFATDHYTRDAGQMALFTRSADVRASQLIYDGAGTWDHLAGAQAEQAAAAGDRRRAATEAALEITRTYLAVLRERALLASAQRYLDRHSQAVKDLEAVARADDGKRFDLEQVRTRAV